MAAKAFRASLELMIVKADTGEIIWGGVGEWKRGGIFGAGESPEEEVCSDLISLAFKSL